LGSIDYGGKFAWEISESSTDLFLEADVSVDGNG
jgi:hypothetical protein